jgi:GWxTD domain-containing protein
MCGVPALRHTAPAIFLAAIARIAVAQINPSSEEWIDSPEAYFLTADERSEWKNLDSRDSRGAFRERYWLRRDPTPGTEKNEFRDLVEGRIKAADDRFRIEKTPGSRTARGFVFIVFGSPARIQEVHATPPASIRNRITVGGLEGTETISRWIYDNERTPRILEALERPSLEIEIILEPARHSDAVQSPGLVKELREKLARKTVVNPDLIPPAHAEMEAPPPPPPPPAIPRVELQAATRAMLEKAPAAMRSGETVFGSAVLWHDAGDPETYVWFYAPPGAGGKKRILQGVVKKDGSGEEVATISEPAKASDAFSSAVPGEVVMKKITLPPGVYDGAFALTEEGAAAPVASASTRLTVPDLGSGSGLAISQPLVTRAPAPKDPATTSPFAIGSNIMPPRADAVFSTAESVWVVLELANVEDPSKVTFEIRLRRGNQVVSGKPPFPARPQPFAPGRAISGFELPLASLVPGDYRLYVMVRDGSKPPDEYELRSAEFRVRKPA